MFGDLHVKPTAAGRWGLWEDTPRGWKSLGVYRSYADVYQARIQVMTRRLLQEIDEARTAPGAGLIEPGTVGKATRK